MEKATRGKRTKPRLLEVFNTHSLAVLPLLESVS